MKPVNYIARLFIVKYFYYVSSNNLLEIKLTTLSVDFGCRPI